MPITEKNWKELEIMARSAVAAGGFAAMGFYRQALEPTILFGKDMNPSTGADVEATFAILHSLHLLPAYATDMVMMAYLFAEELDKWGKNQKLKAYIQKKRQELGGLKNNVLVSAQKFRDRLGSQTIGVLIDGLDGTTNFCADIPYFCSSVAFLIDKTPRVGAIYDPHHNVVYYGSLRSETSMTAYAWRVNSGELISLKEPANPAGTTGRYLPERLVALHLTRSNAVKRKAIIDNLDELTKDSRGTYMLNSGELALAYVASKKISIFFNNCTNSWDVAAGEVLVRAVGGKVTDFGGRDINYTLPGNVEVLAAWDPSVHAEYKKRLSMNPTVPVARSAVSTAPAAQSVTVQASQGNGAATQAP